MAPEAGSGRVGCGQALEILGNCREIGVAEVARRVLDHLAHGVAEEVALGRHADFERIGDVRFRSEEHTSELQSLMRNSYAVFSLKKKKYINKVTIKYTQPTEPLTYMKHIYINIMIKTP